MSSFLNNDISFKSLIKDKKTSDRWYPKPVEEFRTMLLLVPESANNGYAISKNIAYNLQYLEYLQKQLDELVLSDVLEKMLVKNYIIVAMGIIEGLMAYLLKSTGNWTQSRWKLVHKNNIENAKPANIANKTIKIKTEIYEQVDDYDAEMQFDAIISKVKSKNLLNLKDNKIYDIILKYKKLRNKVHLHITQFETDYTLFSRKQQNIIRKLLFIVLSNKCFCNRPNDVKMVYNFLIPQDKP